MSGIEWMARSASVVLALSCAIGLILRRERSDARGLLAFVCLGLTAFSAGSAPGFSAAVGPWLAVPVHALCNTTAFLVLLLARAWFGQDFELRRMHVLLLIGYGGAMVLADYGRFGAGPLAGWPDAATVLYLAGRAVGAAAVLAALWEGLRTHADDLVEERRRVRIIFLALLALAVVIIAMAELALRGAPAPRAWVVLGNALLAAGSGVLLQCLLADGARRALLASWTEAPTPGLAPRFVSAAMRPTRMTAGPATATTLKAQRELAMRAQQAMQNDRRYRIDGLTIAQLATELGSQEYLVRRAINVELGFRNFSDFLHTYRLREATERLRSPEHADDNIVDIALEVGYASLGPFNRAFKARFGLTPSAFRARQPSLTQASNS